MPNILDITNIYRQRLIDREEALEADLTAEYQRLARSLRDDLQALGAMIEDAIKSGKEIKPDWLRRQGRYRTLLENIEGELERIIGGVGPSIVRLQADAIVTGDDMARDLLRDAGLEDLVRLPNAELQQLLGRLQDGSPLVDALNKLAPDGAKRAGEILSDGIVRGVNPRQLAPLLARGLGTSMSSAITLARDEVIGAYRQASIAQYQDHSELLRGWIWIAAVSSTPPPCASCVAMHGTVHPLDEPFGSHGRCRCSAAPLLKNHPVPFETGEQWFKRQHAATQRDILGNPQYRAFKDGAIELKDMVQYHDDPRWGPRRTAASLVSILGKGAKQYYARRSA